MISLILILKKRPEYFFEILNNNYQIADIKFFMKKLMTLLFFTSQLGISQEWPQWGADIDGEGLVDQSGWSVSTNELGNIVAIGAVGNDDAGTNTGYTRIFENVDGTWSQIGDDINGIGEEDRSGYSVSLNNDGTIVAIGAPLNDGGGSASGHVRVFENMAGTWTQIGSDIEGESNIDFSGWSVTMNGDGTIVAIGALQNDDAGDNAGHVRVYEYVTDEWVQVGADIDGEQSGDYSGRSVSLNDEGNIVAIGADRNNGGAILDGGHVRVYENIDGTWIQIGGDIDGEAEEDWNGYSVSLNGDGTILATGAPQNDDGGIDAGYTRVYENIDGTWTQIGDNIEGEGSGDQCGYRVSLNFEGNILAIGSNYNSGIGLLAGNVRLYENLDGAWTQIGEDLDGEAAQDHFGQSVSLNAEGTVVAVGSDATGDDTSPGRVKVFKYCEYLTVTVTAETFCIGEEITLDAVSETGGTISWEDGIVNGEAFVPELGTTAYTATSDSDGDCPYSAEIEIFDLPTVTANVDYTEICFGQSVVFTGDGAVSYVWDMGVTNGVPFGPDAVGTETYTVTGTDVNECVNSASVDVTATEFDPIEITYTTIDEIFGSDGEIDITVSGGSPSYDYDWDNDGTGDFDDAQDLTGLTSGTYIIEIIDNAGCEGSETIVVDSQVGIRESLTSEIEIYPNPTRGMVNLNLGDFNKVSIKVISMQGDVVYKAFNVEDEIYSFMLDAKTGIYLIEVGTSTKVLNFKLVLN